MKGRIDHTLEQARLAGKFVLAYAVAAWLLYLGAGVLLPGSLAKGSPLVLALGLLLAVPAPLLLTRRSRTRRPESLALAWERPVPPGGRDLLQFHVLLQRQTGVSPEQRAQWEERLLDAWMEAPAPADADEAASLRDLLFACAEPGRREAALIARLSPAHVPAADLLLLWARVAARSLEPDPGSLAESCRRLAAGVPPRGLKPAHDLVFRLARADWPEGRELLEALLRNGRLSARDLPDDLRPVYASLAARRSWLSGIPLLRYLRLPAGLERRLPRSPAGRAALGGAFLLALAAAWLAPSLFEDPQAPMQAAPPIAYDYAPPADADGGFTLQILASRDSLQVVEYVQRQHAEGRYVYALAPRSRSSYYRVRLGWFEERAAADSVAALLRQRAVIDEWYVDNFDRSGRLFENLEAPADSGRADADAKGR